MKIPRLLLAILFFTKNITAGSQGNTLIPEPMRFVIIDHNGVSKLTSKADLVTITYMEAGIENSIACTIHNLQGNVNSKAQLVKYNGLGIGCDMGSYSVRQNNPVKYFKLYLNKQMLGIIHYDYTKAANGSYQLKSFTFNNKAVKIDKTITPWVNVIEVFN